MRIRPFQGLVPASGREKDIAAVPYDVVNREEARLLGENAPDNLIHVDRAEIDLPDSVDAYSDEVYAKAQENFERLQADEALIREAAPCLYVYQQVMEDHVQNGLVAVCHVEDYQNDIIRKHEKTRPVKEDDRTRLVSELSANTGPIFLTYRDVEAVNEIVDRTVGMEPYCDFEAEDGVQHRAWRIASEDAEQLVTLFESEVPLGYVADGHHRSASASRVGDERRQANAGHTGDEDYNWFLGVLFPESQLKILAYNRAVKDLNGKSTEEFLNELKAQFEVQECEDKEPPSPNECRMYLDGKWYRIAWERDPNWDPVSALDVSVIQDRVLEPLLGIDDPRRSERIDFIGGIRGTAELEKLVDSGKHAVAFSVYPVSVNELMDIADAGQIMAPKCTWFEPKLRSGLFIHTFERETDFS